MNINHVLMVAAVIFLSACCADSQRVAPPADAVVAAPQAEQLSAVVTPGEERASAAASAEQEAPAAELTGVTRCTQQEDVRILATRQDKEGHWLVVYENDGVSHTIPGRQGTLDEANRLFGRLKKNLVASGFHCE
ncbi:MAG TPA: hypothetical protein VGE00_04115 [Gammaproteobacteria bacterium]